MSFKSLITSFFVLFAMNAIAYDPYRVRSLTLGIEVPFINYNLREVQSETKSSRKLNYVPNSNSFINVSASFTDFSVSLSFENKAEKEKENNFEKSNIFDLQFVGAFQRILWEAYYQNYHGLFLKDESGSSDFEQSNAGSYNYGFEITYFNKESFRPQRAFSNFDIQKETNWSLIQKIKLNNSKLWAVDGLIPDSFQTDFEQIANINSIQVTNVGYEFGVVASYKADYFFTSAMASVGPTLFHQSFDGRNQEDRYIVSPTSSFFLDAGITDSKNKVLSLQFRFENSMFPVKNVEVIRARGIASLSFKYFLP